MNNPNDCIAIIRDAEYTASTPVLRDDERAIILSALISALPQAFNRPWIDSTRTSLERLYEPYRPAEARPTVGQQDAAPVAPGLGESATKAAEGPTSGSEEQAKIIGDVATVSDGNGATAEAEAASEKSRQGKARKQ